MFVKTKLSGKNQNAVGVQYFELEFYRQIKN